MSMRKLAGQTAVYGISSIAVRFLNYLLTPYLTHVMSTGQYGVIGDLYSLIPFALVVLTLGLESGFFRFAGKAGSKEEKDRVFSSAWAAVSLASLLFLCIFFLFRDRITTVTGYTAHPSYLWMTAGIISFDVFLSVPFARLREQGRAGTYVLLKSLSVLLTILFTLFFYSALPALAAEGFMSGLYDPAFGPGYYLLANLIVSFLTVLMILPTLKGMKFSPDWRVLRPMLLYSMPLLLSGIAGTANEFIDRQMIKYLMPADIAMDAVGVYSAVVKIGVVLVLFVQMYRLAAEPYFLAEFKKEDFVRANARAMKYFIIVSIGIFLGIVYFTDFFRLLVGPAFRDGMYILPVVLIGNILAGIVFNLSFWYKQTGRTQFALLVTGTGLVFTIVFNILLIPILGIYGSAIARLICEVAMVAVSYALNRKFCPTPYDLKRVGIYALAGALLYGAGLLTAGLQPVLKYLFNLALLGVFGLLALRLEKINPLTILRR